jgi:hypothetical protein
MQEFIKIALILVTAPLWLPFAKAMKREILDLFEEDGGLFGEDPGPLRRAAIQARRASQPSVLVHEWLAHVRSDAGGSALTATRPEHGPRTGQTQRVEPVRRPAEQRPGQRTSQSAQGVSTHRPGNVAGPAPRKFR